MIRVCKPILAEDGAWTAWNKRATSAMDDLIDAHKHGQPIKLNSALYKEVMPYLRALWNGKCAYCETVLASNQPGDVEHYRPKGRIRDENGTIVKMRLPDGSECDHEGYWWLAYDWTNLLPACIDCNRGRKHGDDKIKAGKAELFAVRGTRAEKPGDDLIAERALLLDPAAATFDPHYHFDFNSDGTIKPKTDEGQYSCKILGLNLREDLVRERCTAFLQAQDAFVSFMSTATTVAKGEAEPQVLNRARALVNDMWEGRARYSAFARGALDVVRNRLRENTGVEIKLPLPVPR